MNAANDLSAGQGLFLGITSAQSHQRWHLGFCQRNFFTPEIGKVDVGYLVVTHKGLLARLERRFLSRGVDLLVSLMPTRAHTINGGVLGQRLSVDSLTVCLDPDQCVWSLAVLITCVDYWL